MAITIQQMRALVAVADLSSFTAAASHLHLTQPAVSRAIGEAERHLGVVIFDRASRTLRPTERGARIVAIARTSLDAFDRAALQMHDVSSGARRSLRIAALPSIAAILLPGVAAHMRSLDEGTDLQIFTGRAENVNELVASEKVDIGIGVASEGAAVKHFQPLFSDELVCVTSKSHRFNQGAALEWSDLAAETFLRLPSDSSVGKLTWETFEAARAVPREVVPIHDLMSAAGLAAAGVGIAVIPALSVPLTMFAELSYFSIRSPRAVRTIGIASKSALTEHEAVVGKKAREIALKVLSTQPNSPVDGPGPGRRTQVRNVLRGLDREAE
ncbi:MULTISPECIES: LysR family transcriptional regulator [Brevibacterium]|uniref:LysR family transcriptional regulator n=1 Tax=Brevibacterium salitolerans TaxID=1403566 RepID=A0ABN2WND6_9MICO|nr:LysR family transcriptional regulator [Brevibacterium sp.]